MSPMGYHAKQTGDGDVHWVLLCKALSGNNQLKKSPIQFTLTQMNSVMAP